MKINDFATDSGDHRDGIVRIDPEDNGQIVDMGAADVWGMYDSYRSDMAVLSDMLAQEAVERGWCSEFEDFVNRVNKNLRWKLECLGDVKAQFVVSFTFDTVIPHQRITPDIERYLVDVWSTHLDNKDVNLHRQAERLASLMGATFVNMDIEGSLRE